MPRRSAGLHPEKVGSDIHDLVRLVAGRRPAELAPALSEVPNELVTWVGQTLVKWFGRDHDLRYTEARLRRFVTADDAAAVAESDMALVGELGAALLGTR